MRFLMFPGQGSQYPGMGKDWFANFREAQLAFEEGSDGSGLDLKKLCFDGSEEDLKQTEVTQPAILTATTAVFRALVATTDLATQLDSALFAGHSLGEYSALVCAGALPLVDGARLVRHRGQYMQTAVPAGVGAMAALIYKPKTEGNWERTLRLCETVSKATGKLAATANNNSPEQVVIAGDKVAIDEACRLATTEEWGARRAVPLPVSAPFHCALMRPAAERLSPELKSAAWKTCARRYVANVDARVHALSEASAVAERLVTQITSSVLWVQSVETALSAGFKSALEIGPGQVLAGLAKRIQKDGLALEVKNVDRWEDFKNAGSVL